MKTTRLYNSISNVEQIVEEVRRTGSHFFDRDTMRFFRSRLAPAIFVPVRLDGKTRGGFKAFSGPIWFVTSEQYSFDSKRLYTVRCYNPKARGSRPPVGTVGEFQAHATIRQAYRAAQLAANAGDKGR